jgi:hypothetical protein
MFLHIESVNMQAKHAVVLYYVKCQPGGDLNVG